MVIPISTSASVSRRTRQRTFPGSAPSARRMPMSLVRGVTGIGIADLLAYGIGVGKETMREGRVYDRCANAAGSVLRFNFTPHQDGNSKRGEISRADMIHARMHFLIRLGGIAFHSDRIRRFRAAEEAVLGNCSAAQTGDRRNPSQQIELEAGNRPAFVTSKSGIDSENEQVFAVVTKVYLPEFGDAADK